MIRPSSRRRGPLGDIAASTTTAVLPLALLLLISLPRLASAEGEEETEPSVAVLFPWFCEVMGIVVFYLLSRWLPQLPYTAVMFIIGTAMGIGAVRLQQNDFLTESILMWDMIDSETLLLIFLPGLIFSDAFGLNVHLLQVSLWQCVNFAFPMVLAGTCLTAIVAFFIFPYGWSWNLAMTFGSILSATDPVAVASLMDEVGAPPRLKMHIGGESLLNDGSAMVFYNIFSALYLTELGVPGVGHQYTTGEGFALFFRMAFGGAAIGLAAGIAEVSFLYLLNKRLSAEENVVQVASTITMAYLTYYVADAICGTSGVIATLTCGVITRAFGAGMINNNEVMENFWSLVEQLLNTLLFALGGVVWGTVIGNPVGEPRFEAKDWGYLFLLYVMLHAYRFFLIFANYPITVRIGLSTNWQESVFSAFGGLRGAVGISLAIAIDNLVWEATTEEKYREQTRTLFGMIGGVAFLTLVVNGTSAGPLLKKLGLADIPEVRKKITDRYERRFRETMIDNFLDGLSDPRFHKTDFALVKHHVPYFADLTMDELKAAVAKQKARTPPESYRAPCLKYTLPYLMNKDDPEGNDLSWAKAVVHEAKVEDDILHGKMADAKLSQAALPSLTESAGDSDETKELRSIFVEVLKAAYDAQGESGEIDTREGFVAYVLEEGLEFAADNANRGKPLSDWEMSEVVRRPWKQRTDRYVDKCKEKMCKCKCKKGLMKFAVGPSHEFETLRHDVHRALAFVKAHREAEVRFMEEFCEKGNEGTFSDPEKLVVLESRAEMAKALAVLKGTAPGDDSDDEDDKNDEAKQRERAVDVEMITSRLLCLVLLNKAAAYVEDLAKSGLLKATEAGEHVETAAERIVHLSKCSVRKYPGQIEHEEEEDKEADAAAAAAEEPKKEEAPLANEEAPAVDEGEEQSA